jgi:hypothetical protein
VVGDKKSPAASPYPGYYGKGCTVFGMILIKFVTVTMMRLI